MDENGLPITGAGVDYSTVEPINQRELVTYINLFLVRTCAFLNSFSTKCESKLAQLNTRLESLDSSLTLLETKVNNIALLYLFLFRNSDLNLKKLNSVDEIKNLKLENENSSNANNSTNETAQGGSIPPAAPPPPPPPLPGQDSSSGFTSIPPPPPPLPTSEPVETTPVNTVSQDARFIKYFKMLKLGVAEEAIRLKMKSEGVDPDLLSNPNAAAPPDDRPSESTDSDNSDSD